MASNDAQPGSGSPLLEVRDLKTHFPVKRGLLQRTVDHVRAVDGVSFELGAGETLGLVGESGCGKTTVGRTLLRLVPATSGEVVFDGKSVFQQSATDMRALRRDMQIIFQDPGGSLNPRMRVGRLVGEPLVVHGLAEGDELQRRAVHEVPQGEGGEQRVERARHEHPAHAEAVGEARTQQHRPAHERP